MVLKQFNKIIILLTFVVCVNAFSQMKMADIEDKEFSVNVKTEKRNIIKISDNSNYSVYYILDRRDFDFKKGLETNGIAKIIFFSKKYSKGILVNLEQKINHVKKNVYEINLRTGSHDKHMFISSMAILDKDFNYEYYMKYYYIHLPYDWSAYTSRISIQDIKNYCNVKHFDIKGNAIYENVDDILSNISNVPTEPKNDIIKKCESIIYDIDNRDYFPNKILKYIEE